MMPHHRVIGSGYFEWNYSLPSRLQNSQIKQRRLTTQLQNISQFYPTVFFCLTFLSPLPFYVARVHKKFKPINSYSISVTMATALVQAAKKGLMSGLPAV
jgi:hypothetical protein